jgi:CRP-like cAMP-binding protein
MEKTAHEPDVQLLSTFFTPEEVNLLMSKSTVVKYHKRETIIKKGEFLSNLVLMFSGYAKVEVEKGNKNLIYDIVRATHLIGLPVVLSQEKYDFSVVSLTDCEVRLLPVDVVKSILAENGKAALEIIHYGNANFLEPLMDKLQCVSHNNVRGRLAHLLLSLAKIHESFAFTLLITRTEMAQMIGFSRENVIRILSEFHTEKVLTISGKHIEIKDSAKLEELARYS